MEFHDEDDHDDDDDYDDDFNETATMANTYYILITTDKNS